MTAILELKPLIRGSAQYANGTFKSERHFFDFVVNGLSLWEEVGKCRDMVSVLCSEYLGHTTAKAVDRLLLRERADLPNDRRSLFVCSECGDLGCGAITMVVEKQNESITWKTFGYENTYENKVCLDEYGAIGPFMFETISYERTLLEALDRYRSAADRD